MTTEVQLAWLAGIIDGEGSISASVTPSYRGGGRIRICPFVTINNTDLGIIEACCSILDGLGIKYCLRARTRSTNLMASKTCFDIRMNQFKKLQILLPLLIPHLKSVKREYAEKILKFALIRQGRGFPRNEEGHIQGKPYSQDEIKLIDSIRTNPKRHKLESLLAATNVVN